MISIIPTLERETVTAAETGFEFETHRIIERPAFKNIDISVLLRLMDNADFDLT